MHLPETLRPLRLNIANIAFKAFAFLRVLRETSASAALKFCLCICFYPFSHRYQIQTLHMVTWSDLRSTPVQFSPFNFYPKCFIP